MPRKTRPLDRDTKSEPIPEPEFDLAEEVAALRKSWQSTVDLLQKEVDRWLERAKNGGLAYAIEGARQVCNGDHRKWFYLRLLQIPADKGCDKFLDEVDKYLEGLLHSIINNFEKPSSTSMFMNASRVEYKDAECWVYRVVKLEIQNIRYHWQMAQERFVMECAASGAAKDSR